MASAALPLMNTGGPASQIGFDVARLACLRLRIMVCWGAKRSACITVGSDPAVQNRNPPSIFQPVLGPELHKEKKPGTRPSFLSLKRGRRDSNSRPPA